MTNNRTTELRISEPLRGFIRHQSNRAYIDGGQARWLTEIADEIDAKHEQAVDDARIVEVETSYIDIEQGEVITRFVPEQAIAATLGSGTCEQVLTDCDDGLMPPFTAHCSACGEEWGFTPKYCNNCGAKVTGTRDERKAVKR